MKLHEIVQQEISDFNDEIQIAGKSLVRNLQGGVLRGDKAGGYRFNQFQMLDLIDMVTNSQFIHGKKDSDGQEKIYLNIVRFDLDVCNRKTDIDIKDYLFIPEEGASVWPAYFESRDFRDWVKDNDYGELQDRLNEDRNKYGSCVIKIVKGIPFRTPLKNLITPQDAESLKKAFDNGESIIEVHEMSWYEMQQYPQWNKVKEFEGKKTVYERYGLIDGKKTMAIIMLDAERNRDEDIILFQEKRESLPYEESHFDKIDGRWLGVGRVERKLEAQNAINVFTNIRRRGLYWATKKIFQSADDAIAKNLIKGVKDGAVLKVSPNGQVSQVNVGNQNLGELQGIETEWMELSDRDGHLFESATGESLPSGTPFRLGVLLSNESRGYFQHKQESFAFFLKRIINNHLVPYFEKTVESHTMSIAGNDQDIEMLREVVIKQEVDRIFREALLNEGRIVNRELVEAGVREDVEGRRFLLFKVRKEMYKNAKKKVNIIITGEERNLEREQETKTTILQLVSTNPTLLQDPTSRALINSILKLQGTSLEAMGIVQSRGQVIQPQQGGARQPQPNQGDELNQLANQNAPNQPVIQ